MTVSSGLGNPKEDLEEMERKTLDSPSSDDQSAIESTKSVPTEDSIEDRMPEKPSPESVALSTPAPYTIYTLNQRRQLRLLLGCAAITSPLTATSYLPLLPLLRTHFSTSAQAINMTLTIYIIFQALSPAIFGPFSDSVGRRLVFMITLALYAVGNLGLALNKSSYPTLLVLRALQSLGASAALSISYGVVADICVPSERGRMLGPISMALNLGACIGPVIGGSVAWKNGNYEWLFWSLVIIGALLLLVTGLFLPETARALVGNGNPQIRRLWWERSLASMLMSCVSSLKDSSNPAKPTNDGSCKRDPEPYRKSILQQCRFVIPLACLRVMFHLDTCLALWMQGSFYVVDYAMVATMPDTYRDIYHFNELLIGLMYIPRGVGIITGGFCIGKIMDYNYRTVAREIGWNIDEVGGDDLQDFPIERARSRGSYILLVISTTVLVGYGWAVTNHAPLAIELILQFIQGSMGTCFYNTYNALLVDVFPESPSTAAAAASIVRCAMAAAGVAILQPLIAALGRGYYFTILGAWSGVCGALVVLTIKRKGMLWRTRRVNNSSA